MVIMWNNIRLCSVTDTITRSVFLDSMNSTPGVRFDSIHSPLVSKLRVSTEGSSMRSLEADISVEK